MTDNGGLATTRITEQHQPLLLDCFERKLGTQEIPLTATDVGIAATGVSIAGLHRNNCLSAEGAIGVVRFSDGQQSGDTLAAQIIRIIEVGCKGFGRAVCQRNGAGRGQRNIHVAQGNALPLIVKVSFQATQGQLVELHRIRNRS